MIAVATWLETLAVIAAIIGSGFLVVLWKAFRTLARLYVWTDKHGPVIVQIAEQFSPNHGTSLHDRITRIENRIDGIDVKVTALRCVRERRTDCPEESAAD